MSIAILNVHNVELNSDIVELNSDMSPDHLPFWLPIRLEKEGEYYCERYGMVETTRLLVYDCPDYNKVSSDAWNLFIEWLAFLKEEGEMFKNEGTVLYSDYMLKDLEMIAIPKSRTPVLFGELLQLGASMNLPYQDDHLLVYNFINKYQKLEISHKKALRKLRSVYLTLLQHTAMMMSDPSPENTNVSTSSNSFIIIGRSEILVDM